VQTIKIFLIILLNFIYLYKIDTNPIRAGYIIEHKKARTFIVNSLKIMDASNTMVRKCASPGAYPCTLGSGPYFHYP